MPHATKPKTRINRAKAIAGQSTILYENLIEFLNPGMVAAFKAYLDSGDSEAAAALGDALSSNVLTTSGVHTITAARQMFVVVDMSFSGSFEVRIDGPINGTLVTFLIVEDASDDNLRIGKVDGDLVDVYGGTGFAGNLRLIQMSYKAADEVFVKLLDTGTLFESPAFTGTPTAPTASQGTNTTQLATTAFVRTEVAALVASSPSTLDTLGEIATALGNDPNLATTLTIALANRLRFDAAQSLSAGEKTQLRTNAGLGTLSTLSMVTPTDVTLAGLGLMGRAASGSGVATLITFGAGLVLSGTALTAPGTYLMSNIIGPTASPGLVLGMDESHNWQQVRWMFGPFSVNEGNNVVQGLLDLTGFSGVTTWRATVAFLGDNIDGSGGYGVAQTESYMVLINHSTGTSTYGVIGGTTLGLNAKSFTASFALYHDVLEVTMNLGDYSTGGTGNVKIILERMPQVMTWIV